MSIRKRPQKRDVPVRMGPGEFVDPADPYNLVAWKRVLDVAAEEIPEFLPSLLHDHPDDPLEQRIPAWLERWHLPDDDYERSLVARLAYDTITHHVRSLEIDTTPDDVFYADPLLRTPSKSSTAKWIPGDAILGVPVHDLGARDVSGDDLERRLRDEDGVTLLGWNPFRETRREAEERLRGYLDIVLDTVERDVERMIHRGSAHDGRIRTPQLPRRHIAWFVRWKFDGETIYGIAKRARVSENAVRHALDNAADALQWGYRNGETGIS
jgi:hypothetical protein